MPNITPELREALNKFKPPFKYRPENSDIVDFHNQIVDLLRGWSYLTGAGYICLPESEAEEIQYTIGSYITSCLNEAAKEK